MFNPKKISGIAVLAVAFCWILPAKIEAEEQEAHKGTLQNWELYGSVRLEGAYWKRYKWYNNKANYDSATGVYSGFLLDTLPYTNLRMGLQNNSYFGVRGKGEKFGFGFEMGLSNIVQDVGLGCPNPDATECTVSQNKRLTTLLRKIYGDWFITENFTLRIGQDWNPANFFISNQVFNSDAGLGYSGALYTGRKAQVKLTVNGKKENALTWKAELAAIKPDLGSVPSVPNINLGFLQKNEEKLPKFEFGGEVGYKVSNLVEVGSKVVGGFTKYDVVVYPEDDPPVGTRETINSNLIGFSLDLKIWKIKTSFTYTQGQNLATYGAWMGNPNASLSDESMTMFFPTYALLDTVDQGNGWANRNPPFVAPPMEIANAKTRQGAVVVGIQALPWLSFETGAGKVEADHEDPWVLDKDNARTATGFLNALERWAVYANFQVTVADGHFQIVPEFSLSDFGGFQKTAKTNEDGGGKLYSYGLKLELDI